MKTLKHIIHILLFLPLLAFTQQITNIHFEQVAKQIHIYYDLSGDGAYTIQVFCSTDNGQSWGKHLQKVSGAVGQNQKAGNGKMIVWDVLKEREKLSGEIRFKIEANLGNEGSTFTDSRDGQTYKWVKIGRQIWMAENLNYKTSNSWWYKNSASNGEKYGILYTWDAAKKACPYGWHLPSDNEWKTLEMYLGMSQGEADGYKWRGTDEGEKLKSTSGWNNNGNGKNSSGFNALPGGFRDSDGSFLTLGYLGTWWTSTEYSGTRAWDRALLYGDGQEGRGDYRKTFGHSVRCLKN